MTHGNYKDLWFEVDDIRHEIQCLEQRLHMDEMDHLRYYGFSNADSEAMDNELMALKGRLHDLHETVDIKSRNQLPPKAETFLKLNDVVDGLRSKYGLC